MRFRSLSIAIACIAAAAPLAGAEQWVDKMFAERDHDFGTVARGSDTVYRFLVKNIYKQDIELVNVRSSCGCTSPSIEKPYLKTGEIGYIVATYNTRTFTGKHGATLTVQVKWNDRGVWRRGETQLRIDGNIRGDVVFRPGAVRFDSVDQGSAAEQEVAVTYAGRPHWAIVDVRGASNDLEVELSPRQRSASRVAYELVVRLKDTAPAGYINDQLILVTNDDRNPRIPIHVSGRVVPAISVAPESVLLGEVKFGQQVSRKVIVRGKKPFRIVSIKCDEDSFQFNVDDQPDDRHVVEIVFDARKEVGDVKQLIQITTDLGEQFQTTLTAYAKVVEPKPEATSTDRGAASQTTGESTAGAASESSGRVASQELPH